MFGPLFRRYLADATIPVRIVCRARDGPTRGSISAIVMCGLGSP